MTFRGAQAARAPALPAASGMIAGFIKSRKSANLMREIADSARKKED
jgi:hypothetical protein